jgi:hypothetical protein
VELGPMRETKYHPEDRVVPLTQPSFTLSKISNPILGSLHSPASFTAYNLCMGNSHTFALRFPNRLP